MRITWLASYPKSGNTWMRFLVYQALFGRAEHSIDVTRKIPDIHRPLPVALGPGERVFAKTHFRFTPAHPQLQATERVVHILRHPKDVLLSGLNYRRLSGVTKGRMGDRDYAETFIRHLGDPQWIQGGMGSWPEHAESWTSQRRVETLTVRYEDLKNDAGAVLRKVLEFARFESTEERLAEAVRASSFEQLKTMEVREKTDKSKQSLSKRLFIGDARAMQSGAMFMNKGRTGQTLAHIGPDLDERFERAFHDALAQFGYADQAR